MKMHPPLILFASLLLGYALNAVYPVSTAIYPPFNRDGLLLIAAGVLPVLWVLRAFRDNGTTHKPGEKPSKLLTHGLFGHTRNPIYLGFFSISLGFAVYMSSLAAFAAPIAYFLAMDTYVIPDEERVVLEAFGKEYEEYKSRVRRWI